MSPFGVILAESQGGQALSDKGLGGPPPQSYLLPSSGNMTISAPNTIGGGGGISSPSGNNIVGKVMDLGVHPDVRFDLDFDR